ncbi:MAG: hypothetical protein R2788_03765 [Saprospiraceae bacterium]
MTCKGLSCSSFNLRRKVAPPGEEGGAKLMLKEGLFDNPKPEVAFGLHISSTVEVGKISYKPGGLLAASDHFEILVKRQAGTRLSALVRGRPHRHLRPDHLGFADYQPPNGIHQRSRCDHRR